MQPVSSSLHPLLHNNTEPREVVHTWNINNSILKLIKNQNILECETITNGNTHIAPITIPICNSIDQMVSYLKVCGVIVDENGVPSFLPKYQTWNIENKSVNLLGGMEALIWNIFCTVTNKSECFNLKDSTIPSIRCHAETIAVIEKIKEHSLNRSYINFLKDDFKVVRILDKETIEKERRNLKKDKHMVKLAKDENPYIKIGCFQPQHPLVTLGETASKIGTVYLASNVIGATAGAASSFFGGGVLGTIAAGSAAYITGGVALVAGGIPVGLALAACNFFRDRSELNKKENILEARLEVLSPEKPLFVEIEPISKPSRIDERILVSKFTWCVTLITHEGSTGDHTKIIVEGINDGFYSRETPRIKNEETSDIGEKFTYMGELNPPITTKLFLSSKELLYDTRTELWMRTSDKVKKMLEAIEEEKLLNPPTFNFWGIHSVFYRVRPRDNLPFFDLSGQIGNNCFTWARNKLEMLDIDLGRSFIDYAAAKAGNYTRKKEEYKNLPIQQLI